MAGEPRRRPRSPAQLRSGLARGVARRRDRLLAQGQPPARDPAHAGREGHRPPGGLRGRVLPGALGCGRGRALDRRPGPGEAAGAAGPRRRRRRARRRRHARRAAPARSRGRDPRRRARVPARRRPRHEPLRRPHGRGLDGAAARPRPSGCGSRRSPCTSSRPASIALWPRSRGWPARWSSSGPSRPSASPPRRRCSPGWRCGWACRSSTSAAASRPLPARRPTRARSPVRSVARASRAASWSSPGARWWPTPWTWPPR